MEEYDVEADDFEESSTEEGVDIVFEFSHLDRDECRNRERRKQCKSKS